VITTLPLPSRSDGPSPRARSGRVFARTLLWLTLAVGLSAALSAQTPATGSITGRIFNPATGEYVRNATVSVAGTPLAVQTEGSGYYRLLNVPAGEVTLSVTYPGYNVLTETITVTGGAVASRDFDITAIGSTVKKGDELVVLDTYVVSATREGNAKAIAEQKAAMNVKTVVSSDNFGEIAEGNIGEFLKFLPGVVLDYVETDTRAARMGGMEARYGSVTLDGNSIANAGGNSRQFEFEAMSINNIEAIEVNKTLTAEMSADAPAGSINLRTRSALDQKEQRFGFTVGYTGNQYEHSFRQTPRHDDSKNAKSRPMGSFAYSSGPLLGGKLAVSATGATSSVFKLQYRHSLSMNYNSTQAQARQAPLITAINYKDGVKITDKDSFGLKVDYQPFGPELRFTLATDYTAFSDEIANRNVAFAVAAAQNDPSSTLTHIIANPVTNANTNVNHSGGTGNKRIDTRNIYLRGEYKGDRFTIDGQVSYSAALLTNGSDHMGAVDRANLRLSRISWTADRPSVASTAWTFTQTSGLDWNNLASYGTADVQANNIVTGQSKTKTQQFNEMVNFEYVLPWRLPTTFKTGLYHQLLVRDASRVAQGTYTWVGPTGNQLTSPMPLSLADFRISQAFGGNIFSLPVPDKTALFQMLSTNPAYFTRTESNRAGDLDALFTSLQDVKEDITAAYVMAQTRAGRWQFVAGVRFENTETWVKTPIRLPDTGNPFPANTVNRIVHRWSQGNQIEEGSYHNFFPSFAATYDITKDFKAKFGYHQAIKRAPLDQLAGQWEIDEANQRVSVPNASLEPETSEKVSAMLEYYFEPAGTTTLHVFAANLENAADRTDWLPAAEFGFGDDPVLGAYEFRGWRTIPGTRRIKGAELEYKQQLTFLPGELLSGTSVFANYAVYSCTKPLPDNYPKQSAAAGVSVRFRKFFGSIQGTWVPDVLTNGNAVPATGNTFFYPGDLEYKKERYIVDIELNYKLTPKLTAFLSGRNAFNEGNTWYYPDSDGRIRQVEKYGGQWTIGVRGAY
jgi:iron complex outermembrane receptor protein